MTQSFQKRALVTGGSRGIGRAIVDRLVNDGFAVVLTWNSDAEAANNVVAIHDGRVEAVQADLSSMESVRTAVTNLQQFGPFDVLVNNAACELPITTILDTSDKAWMAAQTIYATAPFLLIKGLAPTMPSGSAIVNVSSLNVLMPQPGLSGYCAGKSALESLTQVAAKEFASHGITVNAVRPGATDTDGHRAVNPDPGMRDRIAEMTPMGRLGRPEDIANVVAFLAGTDSRWVTGQVLTASGGL